MKLVRAIMRRFWSEERAFTLPEVLITITLMGIVFAVASSTWSAIVEDRRVDSATNQLVADLRLAHSSATNRLAPYRIEFAEKNKPISTYEFGPSNGELETRTMPEGVKVQSTKLKIVEFRPDGQITVYLDKNTKDGKCTPPDIKVKGADVQNKIEVECTTSEVTANEDVK